MIPVSLSEEEPMRVAFCCTRALGRGTCDEVLMGAKRDIAPLQQRDHGGHSGAVSGGEQRARAHLAHKYHWRPRARCPALSPADGPPRGAQGVDEQPAAGGAAGGGGAPLPGPHQQLLLEAKWQRLLTGRVTRDKHESRQREAWTHLL